MWSKPSLLKREKMSHGQVMLELRLEPQDYKKYLRMNEATYLKLLLMIALFNYGKCSLLIH